MYDWVNRIVDGENKDFDFDGLTFNGGAKELILSKDPQVILFGPWVAGKTFALTAKAHLLCKNYPGINVGMVGMLSDESREVGTNLSLYYRGVISNSNSSIRDLKVIETKTRLSVHYPNGSKIIGTDVEGTLACGFDYVAVFGTEFMTRCQWENVLSRTMGKSGKLPYYQVAGDFTWGFDAESMKRSSTTEWVWNNGDIQKLHQDYYHNPHVYNIDTDEFTDNGNRFKNKFFSSGIWNYGSRSSSGELNETYQQ
jgi:hypothetical protein